MDDDATRHVIISLKAKHASNNILKLVFTFTSYGESLRTAYASIAAPNQRNLNSPGASRVSRHIAVILRLALAQGISNSSAKFVLVCSRGLLLGDHLLPALFSSFEISGSFSTPSSHITALKLQPNVHLIESAQDLLRIKAHSH